MTAVHLVVRTRNFTGIALQKLSRESSVLTLYADYCLRSHHCHQPITRRLEEIIEGMNEKITVKCHAGQLYIDAGECG